MTTPKEVKPDVEKVQKAMKQLKAVQGRATQDPDQKLEQQVIALLEGNEVAPNQMVRYLVTRTQNAKTEARNILNRAAELEQQAVQFRTRAEQLRGAVINYVDDIKHLLQEPDG